MQTRIKYTRQADGSYVTEPIITYREMVTARIVGLTYELLGEKGNVLDSGTGTSQADIKKKIKFTLRYLGAKFLDEVRKRAISKRS